MYTLLYVAFESESARKAPRYHILLLNKGEETTLISLKSLTSKTTVHFKIEVYLANLEKVQIAGIICGKCIMLSISLFRNIKNNEK